jgi:hypothetical protein
VVCRRNLCLSRLRKLPLLMLLMKSLLKSAASDLSGRYGEVDARSRLGGRGGQSILLARSVASLVSRAASKRLRRL